MTLTDYLSKDDAKAIRDFVRESNRIEGIMRAPTQAELLEHCRFIALGTVTVADLEQFVSVYQPGKVLRRQVGMNVRVGDYTPPAGGPQIEPALQALLDEANSISVVSNPREISRRAYQLHCAYETLHPFMDGNGRSGRVLWSRCMNARHPLGFLHHWYYQSLAALPRSPA